MNNDVSKKKKTSKEKRVLIGALCIAAVVAAGSTFAWFSSKDEVTNRLTAAAEYGVAIAENFQPPETWVPGQEIGKDVAAVNTGNVDAFVRTWLTGDMRLLKQTATGTAVGSIGTPSNVTDDSLVKLGLTKTNGSGLYYKTLSKSQTINPNASASADMYGFGADISGPYSEVQAMQSGRLAYAPSGATYAYVLQEDTTLPVYLKKSTDGGSTYGTPGYESVTVKKGTTVYVNDASPVESTITDGVFAPAAAVNYTPASGSAYTSSGAVYIQTPTSGILNVDAESFTPFTDGLYLFLRNEANTEVVATDLEYSGYYATGLADKNASGGTFYALNTNTDGTNRSDYTVKSVASGGSKTVAAPIETTIVDGVINAVTPDTSVLQLYTADYDTAVGSNLEWYYVEPDGSNPAKIYVVYDAATSDDKFTPTSGVSQDIVVEITLANVGTGNQQWTAINGTASDSYNLDGTNLNVPASKLTFYYNDDLEAGDTSAKLVDKVKLYNGVTNKAYLAFDFDLNVNLESIQVTFAEDGTEQATAVKPWAATGTVNTGATGAETVSSGTVEIASIAWS